MFNTKLNAITETMKKIEAVNAEVLPNLDEFTFSVKGYSNNPVTTAGIKVVKSFKYAKRVPEIFKDQLTLETMKYVADLAVGRHTYFNSNKGYILNSIRPDFELLNDILIELGNKLNITFEPVDPAVWDEYETYCNETAITMANSYNKPDEELPSEF